MESPEHDDLRSGLLLALRSFTRRRSEVGLYPYRATSVFDRLLCGVEDGNDSKACRNVKPSQTTPTLAMSRISPPVPPVTAPAAIIRVT